MVRGSGCSDVHTEAVTLERLDRAVRERLRPALAAPVADPDIAVWQVRGEPVPAAAAIPGLGRSAYRGDYRPFALGDRWGGAWFRLRGRVPELAQGRRVELTVDLGWQDELPAVRPRRWPTGPTAASSRTSRPLNNWVPVGSDTVKINLEAAANPKLFGHGIPAQRARRRADRR